jgi:hypothetical protein
MHLCLPIWTWKLVQVRNPTFFGENRLKFYRAEVEVDVLTFQEKPKGLGPLGYLIENATLESQGFVCGTVSCRSPNKVEKLTQHVDAAVSLH